MTLVTLALVASTALAQGDMPQARSPAMRCKLSCETHVKNPSVRRTVCGRCFIAALGEDRGGWVLSLGSEPGTAEAITSALQDPDWSVRWGAVRARAKRKGQAALSALATLIMSAEGISAQLARSTAVHLAASKKKSVAELLGKAGRDGPRAAAKLWQQRKELERDLSLELYAIDGATQQEALIHLARFLGVPEGRVVLNAMRSRTRDSDLIAADVLLNRASAGGPPAGLSLLKGAQPDHKEYVDRLFAIYSARIDALRPGLAAAEVETRKATIRELWTYGPLAAVDLERMLMDEVNTVRLLAARAVAAGEGRSLIDAAHLRLKADSRTPVELQARWIDALGESGGKGCDATLLTLIRNPAVEVRARGAAVKALGACGGSGSFKVIVSALNDSSPAMRMGAVQALSYMPRNTKAEAAAAKALSDPDPAVLAAAVRTVGAQRQASRVEQVQALLVHGDASVRAAAVEALATLGGARAVIPISRRLKEDPDAAVRVAAAKALGDLGGPHAPGALGEAAKRDVDSRVQHVALEALRRLGFR